MESIQINTVVMLFLYIANVYYYLVNILVSDWMHTQPKGDKSNTSNMMLYYTSPPLIMLLPPKATPLISI